jgi:LacI family transcriptional regulator
MQEVAKLAHVHVSTASRALDPVQRRLLKPATVSRVEAAAKELGYVPDLIASGLKRGRTKTVGIIVASFDNPFNGLLIRGIASVFEQRGFLPLVAETAEISGRLEPVLRHFLGRRVEAVVTTAVRDADESFMKLYADAGTPIVLAVRGLPGNRFPAVLHDDLTGGFLAASHLLDLGHRVVAALPGPAGTEAFARRQRGFESRLGPAAVEDVTLGEIPVAATLEEGRRLMHLLLDSGSKPTAVFAANDMMAVGAIEALASRGLSCPDDISIVGYDNMPLARHMTPPLTTIDLPGEALGKMAAEMALQAIEQPELRSETIQMPATLIVRGSTAPPPRRRRSRRTGEARVPRRRRPDAGVTRERSARPD